MGHRLLGQLPATRNWQKVIQLLNVTDDPARIANLASQAAQRGLELAKKDQGVANVIFMLMSTVWSSQSDNFTQGLADLGIRLSAEASLLDVVGAFDEVLDKNLRKAGHRTDLAEMARLSAVEALTDICQRETGSLFGINTDDTQKALKKYTNLGRFSVIGRSFFGKFLYRFLDYHLSRELPNHIGPSRNFSNINDYQGFKEALVRHCHETVLIIKDFSGCWPSATEFREGITAENVRTKFIPVAFKKIQSELKQREGANG